MHQDFIYFFELLYFGIIIRNCVDMVRNIKMLRNLFGSLCVSYFLFSRDITEGFKSVIDTLCRGESSVTIDSSGERNPRVFPFLRDELHVIPQDICGFLNDLVIVIVALSHFNIFYRPEPFMFYSSLME